MIIDISQFTRGELLIEGATDSMNASIGSYGLSESIRSFISIYEPEYLVRMLGCDLSESFIAYMNDDSGIAVKQWDDLKAWFDGQRISPIACYVYFHFVRWNDVRVTGNGVQRNNSDNPVVSSMGRLVSAWNLMVAGNYRLADWMDKNIPGYEFRSDPDMFEHINSLGI